MIQGKRIVFAFALAVALAAAMALPQRPAHAGNDTPEDVVRDVFNAVDQADGDAAAALVTEDFILTEIGAESFSTVGRPAFAWLIGEAAASANVNSEIIEIDSDGGTVTAKVEFRDDDATAAGVTRYIENFTIEVEDGLVASAHAEWDLNDASTVKYIDYLHALEEEEPAGEEEDPGPFSLIALAAASGGSQPGEAFAFPLADGVTGVGIDIAAGPEDVQQPAHFHSGTCAAPGPIVHPLANVFNGGSFTVLSTDFEALAASGLILNVHKSTTEVAVYVACGVIEGVFTEPAAQPSPPPAPAASPTAPSGVTAPDTGTGDATRGAASRLPYALLAAGALALAVGATARATRRR